MPPDTLDIYLTNSLSGLREKFIPIQDKHVKLYVCGITPYDFAHLGHGRCYVTFDVLVRLLTFLEYNVTYVRNFTDIDDKIINKTKAVPESTFSSIAERYIQAYEKDMAALNCTIPTVQPRVTTHITPIISFIQRLIEKGYAYVVNHNVYFDITAFQSYGKLSGKHMSDLIAGSRIEINTEKRNPGDFALWKGNEAGEFWLSPWGYGRPGWHIECSAMAYQYLGETIDIHAGGMDLMFPHHENEIAQSESLTNKPFSHYWLHNAFININKEKMSKSLGNTVFLKDIFQTINPMVLRFYFLQHHFKTPIEFTGAELTGAMVAYKRLLPLNTTPSTSIPHVTDYLENTVTKSLLDALCNDLNTPKFFGILFEHLTLIKQSEHQTRLVRYLIQQVLGLTLEPLEQPREIPDEIQLLISERDQARKNKDWNRADSIRDQLIKLGYELQDKKI